LFTVVVFSVGIYNELYIKVIDIFKYDSISILDVKTSKMLTIHR